MRLEGKVAIISGGARGMGAAEARLFAKEGARVVIGDVLDDQGKQVEAEIAETGGKATYVHLDVTSEADWANAVQTAIGSFGKLDVLVNNAGILIRTTRLHEFSENVQLADDLTGQGHSTRTKGDEPWVYMTIQLL